MPLLLLTYHLTKQLIKNRTRATFGRLLSKGVVYLWVGYLKVRLTYPMIRTFPNIHKWDMSMHLFIIWLKLFKVDIS